MSLNISERQVRGVTILDLEGRIVMEDGVSELVEHLNALIRQARKSILLNFDKVTYLDSAGVGAVAWKYSTALRRDVHIKLLNLRRKSHNVLNTTKLLTVLQTFDSEDAAIESFLDDDDDDVNPIFT
jgi:anti-sigma B factor antagonist